MNSSLDRARVLVEGLRFAGDVRPHKADAPPSAARLLALANQSAMRLTPRLLPTLYSAWADACEKLAVPLDSAFAFVIPDSRPRAEVCPDERERCVVRFSSGLVNLLDAQEFMFVAGHELGHFLLGHLSQHAAGEHRSVEDLMLARAAEISVDRVGLRACGSVEASVRAVMKLLAGLNDDHLRFDVGELLRQLDGIEEHIGPGETNLSHPSLVVRARAMLWFAMTGAHISSDTSLATAERATIDARVQSDLVKYVDGPARMLIQSSADDVAMWTAAAAIALKGTFTKLDQQAFVEEFGVELEAKFRRAAQEMGVRELVGWVQAQLSAAQSALRALIPRGYESEMARLHERTARFG